MAVDVLALVALIFRAGSGVIDQCRIVQQCAGEAARIALRTQNVLGLLQVGEEELLFNVPFEDSLLYLRETLETISVLLERCKQPARFSAKASRAFRMKATKAALLQTEASLERVTNDLNLPVLDDIKLLLNNGIAQPDANTAESSSTAAGAFATANTTGRPHEAPSEILESNPDEEKYTLEEARGVIEEGMRARTNGGALVEDVIQDELAKSGGPLSIDLATLSECENNEGDHLALGQGTFGAVLAGRYKNRNVAIKKARAPISATQTLQDFRKEAEIQSVLRHANIVETIAFSVGDDVNPPCLITERMHESLFARLASKIDFPAALGIVLDVCKALRFLHGHGIVHKNIKSPNVLLDRRGKAKLSDFSLADISATINGNTGGGYHSNISSQFWMAPEVNAHEKASARSDIFSLHVVMWEAISNQRAGTGTPIGEMLLGDPGAKLSLVGIASAPAPLLKRMQHLLDRCGSFHSQDRPTMKEITPEVEALHRKASRGGGHHRGAEKRAVVPTAGVAAATAVAEATATAELAVQNDGWPENAHETSRADLWSPQWFSMRRLQHESVATVAAQSPVGCQMCDDEHLSASETMGVGGIESIVAEETAAPPAVKAKSVAAEFTVGSGNRPESAQGTPKAVPWSPHWLWDGRRTLSTSENHPSGGNADEAMSGGGDGGDGSGEERLLLGADTARLGVRTAVALAAVAEATRPSPPWKPDSAHSIMTTSGSGFQRRYVTKPDDEKPIENPRDALALFVAGAARVAQNSDHRTQEYNTVETTSDAENDGATDRGHCERRQGREGGEAAVATPGTQQRVEPRVAPRTKDGRENEEGNLVAQVMCDTQTQASEEEQGRARGGNILQQEEQNEGGGGEKEEEEEEAVEAEEEGDKHDSASHRRSNLSTRSFSVQETSRRRQHDRAVLMALFERCRGSLWPCSDNWASEEPLSAWYNVAVDGWGHITKLVLSRNQLAGELPAELGMLAFLRELRLHRNYLRGRIPHSIGGLSSLVFLDLHGNRLCGCIPKGIGNLALLENLDLGNNNLSGPIPAEIGQLRNLRAVSLQRNQLTGSIPPQLGKLGALQGLDFSCNNLEGPIPTELGDLRALTEITIGGNRLTGDIPSELGKLSRLVVLELHDNQLSGNIPPAVRNLTQMNLQHLELAGNDLADDTLASSVLGSSPAIISL